MSQYSLRIHLSVIKVLDHALIDPQWQFQRRECQAVFKARDELGFPAEALHLPAPQDEGGYGDYGKDYQTRTVLFADSCHFCGSVEDRNEVWVKAVGTVGESSLVEDDAGL